MTPHSKFLQSRYEGTCPHSFPMRSITSFPTNLNNTPLFCPPFTGHINSAGTHYTAKAMLLATGDLFVFATMPYQTQNTREKWFTPLPKEFPTTFESVSVTKLLTQDGKVRTSLEIAFDHIISVVEWTNIKADSLPLHWSGIKPNQSAHDTMSLMSTLEPLRAHQPTLSGL